MKFLCHFDETDAVCPPCEVEDHDGCMPEFESYGRRWKCTCPCEPAGEATTPPSETGHEQNVPTA